MSSPAPRLRVRPHEGGPRLTLVENGRVTSAGVAYLRERLREWGDQCGGATPVLFVPLSCEADIVLKLFRFSETGDFDYLIGEKSYSLCRLLDNLRAVGFSRDGAWHGNHRLATSVRDFLRLARHGRVAAKSLTSALRRWRRSAETQRTYAVLPPERQANVRAGMPGGSR